MFCRFFCCRKQELSEKLLPENAKYFEGIDIQLFDIKDIQPLITEIAGRGQAFLTCANVNSRDELLATGPRFTNLNFLQLSATARNIFENMSEQDLVNYPVGVTQRVIENLSELDKAYAVRSTNPALLGGKMNVTLDTLGMPRISVSSCEAPPVRLSMS